MRWPSSETLQRTKLTLEVLLLLILIPIMLYALTKDHHAAIAIGALAK